jgi:hypothetical protein
VTTPATTPTTSSTGPALNARLTEFATLATTTRSELLEYVKSLPDAVLTQRAVPERWSVAEILEHLSITEDGMGRLISTLAKQLRNEGAPQETETSSILGVLDGEATEYQTRKLVAPERIRPTGAMSAHDALEKLQVARARLLDAVHAANGLDFSKASFPHPFLGALNGYQWLVFICRHEMRHLKQMKETVNSLPAAH